MKMAQNRWIWSHWSKAGFYQNFDFSFRGVGAGRVVDVDDVFSGVALLDVVDHELRVRVRRRDGQVAVGRAKTKYIEF